LWTSKGEKWTLDITLIGDPTLRSATACTSVATLCKNPLCVVVFVQENKDAKNKSMLFQHNEAIFQHKSNGARNIMHNKAVSKRSEVFKTTTRAILFLVTPNLHRGAFHLMQSYKE
jgi:hypothetical protein